MACIKKAHPLEKHSAAAGAPTGARVTPKMGEIDPLGVPKSHTRSLSKGLAPNTTVEAPFSFACKASRRPGTGTCRSQVPKLTDHLRPQVSRSSGPPRRSAGCASSWLGGRGPGRAPRATASSSGSTSSPGSRPQR